MINRVRDYGFAAWLRMNKVYINNDLTVDLPAAELKRLNDLYRTTEFFVFNQVLRELVKSGKLSK